LAGRPPRRAELLGDARERAHVVEQHRHLAALAAEPEAARIPEHPIDPFGRE